MVLQDLKGEAFCRHSQHNQTEHPYEVAVPALPMTPFRTLGV